jgi:hypothetical protein
MWMIVFAAEIQPDGRIHFPSPPLLPMNLSTGLYLTVERKAYIYQSGAKNVDNFSSAWSVSSSEAGQDWAKYLSDNTFVIIDLTQKWLYVVGMSWSRISH